MNHKRGTVINDHGFAQVMAAPKARPQLISVKYLFETRIGLNWKFQSDEPGPPLATSTTSKPDKVLKSLRFIPFHSKLSSVWFLVNLDEHVTSQSHRSISGASDHYEGRVILHTLFPYRQHRLRDTHGTQGRGAHPMAAVSICHAEMCFREFSPLQCVTNNL